MTLPLILKFADWPTQDKSAWDTLFSDGDYLEEGVRDTWVASGRSKRMQGYGRWLSFILSAEPGLSASSPTSRITPERVAAYIHDELERCKPITVVIRVEDLLAVARAFSDALDDDDLEENTEHDKWFWLSRMWNRLNKRHGKTDLKPRLPVSSEQVFSWAIKAMRRADLDAALTPLQRASQFRDALMIGLLIARPVRARAFIAIEVGSHLVQTDTGFRLDFSAADMKDKRPHSWVVPERLVAPLHRYLDHHRRVLLRGNEHDALWITRYGKPMARQGWTRALSLKTEEVFGVTLRPHAFRHIAATSIAIEDPRHHGIIRDLLGHATMTMSERHYNRATSLESCNKLQSFVEDIGRGMGKMGNRKQKRSSGGRSGT